MTTLTFTDANQLIIDRPLDFASKTQFLELVSRISVEASGSVTILYGEGFAQSLFGNTISTSGMIEQIAHDCPDVRTINKTELAKFLDFEENKILAVAGEMEKMLQFHYV